MKKQILFMMFLSLAFVFAGVNNAYGQTDADYLEAADVASITCVTPTSLGDCAADNHLSPIPGQTYTYEIGVNPTLVTNGNVQWFVYNTTDNADAIITAGSIATAAGLAEDDGGTSLYLLDAEDAVYNQTSGNVQATIDISWQSFNGNTKEILLVAYVTGEDCSDNIEVWRIKPTFAFTLDIAGLMDNGTLNYGDGNTNANECVSLVQSASYAADLLTMDYGENYIYFVVNAANYVHSWLPTFSIEGNTTETLVELADITWAYPDQAIANDGTDANGTWNLASTVVTPQDGSDAVGADGDCIIVRVHLDHDGAENNASAARSFTLGVNGIMYDAAATAGNEYGNANLADLDPGDSAPCDNTGTDSATYDLTPRPEVTEVAPTPAVGPFETKN